MGRSNSWTRSGHHSFGDRVHFEPHGALNLPRTVGGYGSDPDDVRIARGEMDGNVREGQDAGGGVVSGV